MKKYFSQKKKTPGNRLTKKYWQCYKHITSRELTYGTTCDIEKETILF